jgi:hypothetical protein|tara:strand:+ start:167 stop:370 length:204 start_codon:yes stop_codon:yes gene_type:complete
MSTCEKCSAERATGKTVCEKCYGYLIHTKSERECQWCSDPFIVPMLSEEPDTFCSRECFIASEGDEE